MAPSDDALSPLHRPVLVAEVLAHFALGDRTGPLVVDGTVGYGGHAEAMLSAWPRARLLGLDRDLAALTSTRARLEPFRGRARLFHASYADLDEVLAEAGEGRPDAVLLDLGVSSPQLDDPHRGFSFLQDGPLDMRMDPHAGRSAAEWIARARAEEIERVLREYGEERFARRMAAAIVRERASAPIHTTTQLARIVAAANPAWEKGKHPATRAFQAIRIFVNGELEALVTALAQAAELLRPGGRLVVISFHSLEDRIVKRFMRDASRHSGQPGMPAVVAPRLQRLGRAMRPCEAEVANNPRARSAVLRVAERLASDGRAA